MCRRAKLIDWVSSSSTKRFGVVLWFVGVYSNQVFVNRFDYQRRIIIIDLRENENHNDLLFYFIISFRYTCERITILCTIEAMIFKDIFMRTSI